MPIDTRHPRDIRADIRSGKLIGTTSGRGQNYVQANLAVLLDGGLHGGHEVFVIFVV